MAQYQHLPIYKATYDLLARVTQATAGFSKAYKYSLGVRQTAHSYFGILGHANTWKLQGQMASFLHRAGYAAAVPDKINSATFPL